MQQMNKLIDDINDRKSFTAVTSANDDGDDSGASCPLHGPASGGIDRTGTFSAELLASILGTDEPDPVPYVSPFDLIPKELQLSERCFELGCKIGPEAKKQGRMDFEVGGFFLVETDDPDFVFRDFIVPKDLPVMPGNILLAEHYDSAARENQDLNAQHGTNLKLGAMFHVHPSGGKGAGLYHSTADDQCLESLLNKFAKTTRRVHESPYRLIESKIQREYGAGELCLRGDALSDAVQRFVYPDDELFFKVLRDFGFKPNPKKFSKPEFLARLLDAINAQTYEPRLINFAVSFVFGNHHETPYVKVAVQEKYKLSGTEKTSYNDHYPLKIVPATILPTDEQVAELVKTRVKFRHQLPYEARRYVEYDEDGEISYIERLLEHVQHPGDWKGKKRKKGKDTPASPPLVWDKATHSWVPSQHTFMPGTAPAGGNYALKDGADHQSLTASLADLVKDRVTSLARYLTRLASLPEAAAPTASSNSQSKQFPVAMGSTSLVEKTTENSYAPAEIAQQFALSAMAYLARYRQVDCQYSTYMDSLLGLVGVYNYQSPYLSQGVTHPKALHGLRSSIMGLGELVPDLSQIVERHKVDFYKISSIIINIADEMSEESPAARRETFTFMARFVAAPNIKTKNKLLEDYVAAVLHPVLPGQTDPPVVGSQPVEVTVNSMVNSTVPVVSQDGRMATPLPTSQPYVNSGDNTKGNTS